MDQILVTGGAGFIANANFQIDDISFHKEDIRNKDSVSDIFKCEKIHTCIHLAAKINVSESIANPFDTLDINIQGTLNVLEACSKNRVDNFVFASLLLILRLNSIVTLSNPKTIIV